MIIPLNLFRSRKSLMYRFAYGISSRPGMYTCTHRTGKIRPIGDRRLAHRHGLLAPLVHELDKRRHAVERAAVVAPRDDRAVVVDFEIVAFRARLLRRRGLAARVGDELVGYLADVNRRPAFRRLADNDLDGHHELVLYEFRQEPPRVLRPLVAFGHDDDRVDEEEPTLLDTRLPRNRPYRVRRLRVGVPLRAERRRGQRRHHRCNRQHCQKRHPHSSFHAPPSFALSRLVHPTQRRITIVPVGSPRSRAITGHFTLSR